VHLAQQSAPVLPQYRWSHPRGRSLKSGLQQHQFLLAPPILHIEAALGHVASGYLLLVGSHRRSKAVDGAPVDLGDAFLYEILCVELSESSEGLVSE